MHDTQYSDNEYVPIVCKSFSKEKKKLIKLCNTNSLILKNFNRELENINTINYMYRYMKNKAACIQIK